jgi:uroporphyrinogen decarboxylase
MKLGYVFDAIKLTKEMLNDEVPLIGFALGQLCVMQ